MSTEKNIVVIGGGIAGLSAAYYLNKQIKDENLPYRVTLVEASDRLGGKMQTLHKDGFMIERGPDSWLASKKSISDLAKEVGIGDTLTNSVPGGISYICSKNKLYKVPGGAIYGIPTKILPFAGSNLMSPAGKVRAGMDLFIRKTKIKGDDVALGPFLTRRLGEELVQRVVDPLLSGIYAGDLEEMSTLATFPDLLHQEQKYHSLILGMKLGRKKKPKSAPADPSVAPKPKGMFMTFNQGLESMIAALEAAMPEVTILKNNKCLEIKHHDMFHAYRVLLSSGNVLSADAIVLATEHRAITKIFPKVEFLEVFDKMPASSVVNVTLAYEESAITKDMPGNNFLVATNSDYRITACTWLHQKWPHTAPKGYALLRAFIGKITYGDSILDMTDEEIVELALKDVRKQITFSAPPLFTVVNRWMDAMPQYTVGHMKRLQKVREEAKKHYPGIFFAGGSHDGIGMADCVTSGKNSADTALAYLKTKDY